MAGAVSRLQGFEQVMAEPFFFGVRHLSPAAGIEIKSFLDKTQPELVLVEGPSDLNAMIDSICNPRVRFPIAIMAYTEKPPVRSILYPFAEYSPEVQALLWAHQHGVKAAFMDLPSSVFLALPEHDDAAAEDGAESTAGRKSAKNAGVTESVYEQLELLTGESHESWWERNFEQLGCTGTYREAANAFGKELRNSETGRSKRELAETLVREAYMKRTIADAVKSGVAPEKIVCICGAFHVGGLETNTPLADDEMNALPSVSSFATLLPYSFFRLSSASGYGAGNSSPSYYQLLFEAFARISADGADRDECMKDFAAKYLVSFAHEHRNTGNIISSASLIEAMRLSQTLAGFRGSRYPNLEDLHDAMTATVGHGHFSEIVYAATKVEIQPTVGYLPQGMSKTAVQDDFNRQLEELKIEKYKSEVASALELDLREKLSVQSQDAAFRDLYRSFFLNRLVVLGIHFATLVSSGQSNMNWKEVWSMQWSPEVEIQVVEASLLGDSIAGACSQKLKEQTDSAESIEEATSVFRLAFLCGLPEMCRYALKAVQALSADDNALAQLASTAEQLSTVVRYGDLRKFDAAPLRPMLEKLYLRSVLIMQEACKCDDDNAKAICESINKINVLQLNHDYLDESMLVDALKEAASRDDLTARCSGFAMSLLLERGKCSDEALSVEISRRLSKGTPADLAAAWFEGLSAKNHYALIARLQVWKQINQYIESLDEDEFMRALIVLRRTFAEFAQKEKCEIAENLGEIWGFDVNQVSEALTKPVTEEEQKTLSELNDFDFDDI